MSIKRSNILVAALVALIPIIGALNSATNAQTRVGPGARNGITKSDIFGKQRRAAPRRVNRVKPARSRRTAPRRVNRATPTQSRRIEPRRVNRVTPTQARRTARQINPTTGRIQTRRNQRNRKEYNKCASFSIRVLQSCSAQAAGDPQKQSACRSHYQGNVVRCQSLL